MAEQKKTPDKQEKQPKKDSQSEQPKVSKRPVEQLSEALIRIYGFDIPVSRKIGVGLTRIKGISWSVSNVICLKLNIDKHKKIGDLSKDDIARIEAFLDNPEMPEFLKNRRFDPETGKSSHLFTTDLDIAKDFDIKKLKKIKSYIGVRHTAKLPVRGQRTRSHFRTKNKVGGGIKVKKKAPAAGASDAKKA